jgi:phosphoribosylformylglycinamidine cyclo-ligase
MMPENLGAEIQKDSWAIPPIFSFLEKRGNLNQAEMFNIFNMGIGMVLAVSENDAADFISHFEECGEKAYVIGKVTGDKGVSFK